MWVLLALLSAVFSSLYYLSAQNIKMDANTFMVYRGWLVAAMLLPILILNPIKFPPMFYFMALIQGAVSAYIDYVSFGLNKKYGSETVGSITPLTVVIVFAMWCFIDTDLLVTYWKNPLQTGVIFFSCAGVAFAINRYHQVEFTRQAFYKILPLLLLISLVIVLSKLVMNYSSDRPILAVLWQNFIIAAVIGIVHLGVYRHKKLSVKNLILPKNLFKGLIFLYAVGVCVLKTLAIYYAQNPAYVSALAYTSIIWVIIFSHSFRIFKFNTTSEQAAIKWKILFLVSVVMLILATH